MKKYIKNIKLGLIAASLFAMSSCNDFLEREPLDNFTDDTFWTSEAKMRVYTWKFYDQFLGYGKGVGYASEFYFQAGGSAASMNISDDLMANAFLPYEGNASASNSDWKTGFENVFRANIMLDRLPRVPNMSITDGNHWKGIAHFFRAFAYFKLVQRFGDVPYYDFAVTNEDGAQKKFLPRTSRKEVMDKIIADLDIAFANVKTVDVLSKENMAFTRMEVNKDVVLALKSRACLFEGTHRKYHNSDAGSLAESAILLGLAKDAALELINTGRYYLAPTFKETYNTEDLAPNREMILFKPYQLGVLTHSVQAFNNTSTAINGMSKWTIDSYLCSDGFPISQSPQYVDDLTLANVLSDRDRRLVTATETKDISYRGMKHRNPGLQGRVSTTGYVLALFNNPASSNVTSTGQNTTDAPVFGYAEVLLNYAEACAELGVITNADLDLSINLLRARAGVAKLETGAGGTAIVGGVSVNDPVRINSLETATGQVSPIIWEVRRERRVELMSWTFMRYFDLMRWKKGAYLDFEKNENVNRGLYLGVIPQYPNKDGVMVNEDIKLDAQGYLIPYPDNKRVFDETKHYLNPIPTGQRALYTREGVTFPQNPKW